MTASVFYPNPRIRLVNSRWSNGLATLLCLATLLLLAAGAMVTGTGSSLAVPDWPLAYGELFPPMVGGILYEHGHRLIAATVGLITLILGAWLLWAEERRWVKILGGCAVLLVILQGVMGGLTVILLLPTSISIAHAIMAHLFFLMTVVLYQVTHPAWSNLRSGRGSAAPRGLRIWGLVAVGAILLELLLGAAMRHNSAGLAIPDYPLAFGGLIPPLDSFPVVIHFLHRLGAVLALTVVGGVVWQVLARHRKEPLLLRPALGIGVLVILQAALGGLAVLTQLDLLLTTLHVVNGSLLLGTAGLLTLRAARLEFASGVQG
ncbi:MAG: COX15/CtaA family protein [SAR324 cluster bacterium]|nr:COX15/CtaA family protein [SAR324 cluster bacterium]